jgi:hypothetical protein
MNTTHSKSIAAGIVFSTLAIICGLSGCSTYSNNAHFVQAGYGDPGKYGDDFKWQSKGPIEFLEHLKLLEFPYDVHGFHYGWIRAADIPELVSRLDSKVECAPVMSTLSSHIPTVPSSEGHEAAFLIEGFRKGRYPPDLASTHFSWCESELRNWYTEWSRTNKFKR